MSQYQLINIADRLISDNYKLVLIENCTRFDFVTSDNPAINTYSYVLNSENSSLK